MSTLEHKPMTPNDLAIQIERFVSDNGASRSVESRWLAYYLADALRVTRQVRSSNLDPELRQLVNKFRLAEIEEEKRSRQREIDRLDAESRRLASEELG